FTGPTLLSPSRSKLLPPRPRAGSPRHDATSGPISFILRPLHLPVQQLLGFPSPLDNLLLHRQGSLHGQRGHLLEQDRADHGIDVAARDGGTDGHTLIALGLIARRDGIASSARAALAAAGHVRPPRTPRDGPWKAGGALRGWTGGVMAGVALKAFLVGLEPRPPDIARRGAFDEGMPVGSGGFPIGGPATWTLQEA